MLLFYTGLEVYTNLGMVSPNRALSCFYWAQPLKILQLTPKTTDHSVTKGILRSRGKGNYTRSHRIRCYCTALPVSFTHDKEPLRSFFEFLNSPKLFLCGELPLQRVERFGSETVENLAAKLQIGRVAAVIELAAFGRRHAGKRVCN